MKMKKENVLAAYETARKAGADSTMKVLETLFGEETFKPKDVTERIKTFEDACQELGEEHPLVVTYRAVEDIDECGENIEAYLKLQIIVAALNEGWTPELKEGENLYYPWHWLYTQSEIDDMNEDERRYRRMMKTGDYVTEYAGFAYAYSDSASPYAAANVGSRLYLKSRELASYCGKQFIRIWADTRLIRRR